MCESRMIAVVPGDVGGRVDVVLGRRLGVSRAQARRVLAAGRVTLNGRAVGPSDKGLRLAAGDSLTVGRFEHPRDQLPKPSPDQPLVVVNQGPGWLIVNKPAGMPVHPLRSDERGTVMNAAIAHYPAVAGVGEGGLRSGVVHRLDVTTSGTLLVGLDDPAWRRLRQAFRNRTIEKSYLALVAGRLTGCADEQMRLTVAQHRPARVRVIAPQAKSLTSIARLCTLRWRSLAATDTASLIEIRLGTGFLHQIRAMLAHRGHPLLGDPAYGGPAHLPDAEFAIPRPMLHAQSLRIEEIRGQCDPPADFTTLATTLDLSATPQAES